jgi:hypothetical protein
MSAKRRSLWPGLIPTIHELRFGNGVWTRGSPLNWIRGPHDSASKRLKLQRRFQFVDLVAALGRETACFVRLRIGDIFLGIL